MWSGNCVDFWDGNVKTYKEQKGTIHLCKMWCETPFYWVFVAVGNFSLRFNRPWFKFFSFWLQIFFNTLWILETSCYFSKIASHLPRSTHTLTSSLCLCRKAGQRNLFFWFCGKEQEIPCQHVGFPAFSHLKILS